MNNNDIFLGLYKRLDTLLDGIYHPSNVESSVYLKELELKKSDILSKRDRGDKYTIIRQMRNMLSHQEINLNNPFTVHDDVISFLEAEIKGIENAKTAIDVAIKFDSLIYAKENSNVRSIAKIMTERGITNVPILRSRKIVGIFNGHALMQLISKNNIPSITEYTQMNEIMTYVGLKSHPGIRYEFVSKDTNTDDLEKLFKRNSSGKTELLIVTENGSIQEPVLGIISPHDILEK